MTDRRTTFLSAADSFVAQVAGIPVEAMTGLGLGDWDLRALVGHTARSLVTVDTYLDQPAEEVVVHDAAGYYAWIAAHRAATGTAVVERGRRAGAALGDDPAAYVAALLARVGEKLAAYDDAYVLTTIVGGMPLGEYLRTRTFEIVVHGLDIAAASDVGADHGEEALADAATLAVEVAVRTGQGPDLLLALTGRADFPDGFSVV